MDFQRLSKLRAQEARALLTAGCFQGAYYLVGYSVECALKSCVAKQVRRHEFPDKKLAAEVHTHDLEKLIRVAGLTRPFDSDRAVNRALELNWAIVKDWSEEARYDDGISEKQARDLYSACVGRNGVTPWIKKRW